MVRVGGGVGGGGGAASDRKRASEREREREREGARERERKRARERERARARERGSARARARARERERERFRGGLVLKAHRLLYHSTPGLRQINKKKKKERSPDAEEQCDVRRDRGDMVQQLERRHNLTGAGTWLSLSVYPRRCIRICSAMVGVPHRPLLTSLPTPSVATPVVQELERRHNLLCCLAS